MKKRLKMNANIMACKLISYTTILFFTLMTAGCSDDTPIVSHRNIVTRKVAVIMPATNRDRWERTVNWALRNYSLAQQDFDVEYVIEAEWHDENASDLAEYAAKVSRDDMYAAVIGPYTSAAAHVVVPYMVEKDKTIILPAATSTEFQRIFAEKKNVWNLAQSDIAQGEIIISQSKSYGHDSVCLVTSDDTYGKSFSDWFAFQATELGVNIQDIVVYGNETELESSFYRIADSKGGGNCMIMFAPGKVDDVMVLDKVYGELLKDNPRRDLPKVMCSDMAHSPEILKKINNVKLEGLALVADPASGFRSAYTLKYNTEPISGEAHLFDSVTLLGYAFAVQTDNESLYDTILRLVDGDKGNFCSWQPTDMANSIIELRHGNSVDLEGVTGEWDFDSRNHSSVLNTIYAHWVLDYDRFLTLEYLSTDGSRRSTSSLQLWETQSSMFQQFNNSQEEMRYGPLQDRWAFIISTSDTWVNYRHQADAYAMYQLLKRHGYDDDHIVLVAEDNIADDPRNIYPGKIFVTPGGDDIYAGLRVDYKLSDLTISDLKKILLGESDDRLKTVINSSVYDNVIVFWCGHGNHGKLAWGENDVVEGTQVREVLQQMKESNKFRKLMFVMDACYSGSIGEECTGIPGVLFITAADSNEPSKADKWDKDLGVWLSNGFTRAFQETIDSNPELTIRDLYYILARSTIGSHAKIYNIENYGNAYSNSIKEFLH